MIVIISEGSDSGHINTNIKNKQQPDVLEEFDQSSRV